MKARRNGSVWIIDGHEYGVRHSTYATRVIIRDVIVRYHTYLGSMIRYDREGFIHGHLKLVGYKLETVTRGMRQGISYS